LTNAKAQVGDALILTKPMRPGVVATAIKAGLVSQEAEERVIEVSALNKWP